MLIWLRLVFLQTFFFLSPEPSKTASMDPQLSCGLQLEPQFLLYTIRFYLKQAWISFVLKEKPTQAV